MKTAREMLDQMDEFLLNAPVEEADRFWNIITGLRGPDDGNPMMKGAGTGVIRSAAFPRLASDARERGHEMWSRQGAQLGEDSAACREARRLYQENPDRSHHFWAHVYTAFTALGLKY